MEERKARIVAVTVLVGVLLGISAAWGQVTDQEGIWAGQPPRRLASPPVEAPGEMDVVPPEQIDELTRRREELTERARQRQMELRELQESRAVREREIRGELSDIQAELAGVEADLARLLQRQAEVRRRALAQAERRSAAMSEQLRDLSASADEMRRALSNLRETDAVQGQMLRDSLMQTRRQLRRLEMAPPQPPEAPPLPQRRLRMQLEVEPSREAPAVREELRNVLEELREARAQFEEETQIQREPSHTDTDLSARVDQLSLEVGRLYGQRPAERSCVAVPTRPVRQPGTIGSAGYDYGWQPNYGLYYLY